MVAAKMKPLAERKQELIGRGDLYRQEMARDFEQLELYIGWVTKALSLATAASPPLILTSPLIAWLVRGRGKNTVSRDPSKQKRAGTFGRIWGAIRIFRQVVPFVHGFVRAWPVSKNSKPSTPEQPSTIRHTRQS